MGLFNKKQVAETVKTGQPVEKSKGYIDTRTSRPKREEHLANMERIRKAKPVSKEHTG